MPGPAKDKLTALFEVAEPQDGYFTAKQAHAAGYSQRMQSYHVSNGDWEREQRGVFRLKHFRDRFDDYMVWYLWSNNRQGKSQGVFSHDTALAIHELSTWTANKIHMTVPKRFRRFKEIPAGLQLHYGDLSQEFVSIKNRVPVTTPLKTLLDLLASEVVPRHHLLEAMQQCVQAGLIHRNDILDADLTKTERQLLFDCYQSAAKFNSET
jgi:predicted transcriptional regulator of viral defense system